MPSARGSLPDVVAQREDQRQRAPHSLALTGIPTELASELRRLTAPGFLRHDEPSPRPSARAGAAAATTAPWSPATAGASFASSRRTALASPHDPRDTHPSSRPG